MAQARLAYVSQQIQMQQEGKERKGKQRGTRYAINERTRKKMGKSPGRANREDTQYTVRVERGRGDPLP